MADWKEAHANHAREALDHELVQEVMDELAGNLGEVGNSLVEYGIEKVALYAAQVARAQALGFDPDLLRLSSEEADEESLRLARAAVEAGKPVFLIDPKRDG